MTPVGLQQHGQSVLRQAGWVCPSCRPRPLAPSAKNKSLPRDTTVGSTQQRHRWLVTRGYSTTLSPDSPRPSPPPARPERPPHQRLPSSPARTRFAPSPTGYLHLGSLRTALYNFLLSKATNGQFLLRIEDTDQKRTIPDAEERLYQDLKWAGLQWDEGPDIGGPYGPYKQSERTALYREHAEKLLDSGHAYRCFGSDDLNQHAIQCRDKKCSDLSPEESLERATHRQSFVVRLRIPQPEPVIEDLVYGTVRRPMNNTRAGREKLLCFRDPVIMKSDGFPTYHLANVVDDHHMGITHVLRGVEWLPSAVIHLALYNAFQWTPPAFAHLGLLQNKSRQKLSKRDGDAGSTIRSLATSGIFPEALTNYAVLHGWSHSLQGDFLTLPDLIKNFDLKFTKGDTLVSPEKLHFFQKKYAELYASRDGDGNMFRTMVEKVVSSITETARSENIPLKLSPTEITRRADYLIREEADHYTTPTAFATKYAYFFLARPRRRPAPRLKCDLGLLIPAKQPQLIQDHLASLPTETWSTAATLKPALDRLAQRLRDCANGHDREVLAATAGGEVARDLSTFFRWAVCFDHDGPPTSASLAILGREDSLSRVADGLKILHEMQEKGDVAAGGGQ